MKKFKKIFKYSAIGAVLILTGGYVAYRQMFSPKRVSRAIEETIEKSFNRKVSVESVKLSLGEVILEDITVNQKESAEAHPPFLKCKEMRIKFRMLPILKRNFEFTEVLVHKPEFNVSGLTDMLKEVNIMEFLENLVLNPDKGIQFKLHTAQLKNGTLNLIEEGKKTHKIRNINIFTTGKEISKPIEFNMEFKTENNLYDYANIVADIYLLRSMVELKYVRLTGAGGSVKFTGKIKNIFSNPVLNCSYKVEEFPGEILTAGITLENKPEITGNIQNDFKNLKINWRGDFTPCRIRYKEKVDKHPGSELLLQGGITVPYTSGPSDISVNWFVLDIPAGDFSGTGKVYESGNIEINIMGERIKLKNLKETLNYVDDYLDSGLFNLNGRVSGSSTDLKFFSEFTIKDLIVKNIPVLKNIYKNFTGKLQNEFYSEEVKGDIFVDGNELQINNLMLKGPNVGGSARGFLTWGEDLDFTFNSIINNQEVDLRMYGDINNFNIGLK